MAESDNSNPYRVVFGQRKRLLPVIHVGEPRLALRNLVYLMQAGCRGCFLIPWGAGDRAVDFVITGSIQTMQERYPQGGFRLGFNPLGSRGSDVIYAALDSGKISMWWSDYGGVDSRQPTRKMQHPLSGWLTPETPVPITFFGSDFKGQDRPSILTRDYVRACRRIQDVITTTGQGTGIAADPRRIRQFHHYAHGHPTGIASGITPENVHSYLDAIDAFLVATGISKDTYRFDVGKLSSVQAQIEAYNREKGLVGGLIDREGASMDEPEFADVPMFGPPGRSNRRWGRSNRGFGLGG